MFLLKEIIEIYLFPQHSALVDLVRLSVDADEHVQEGVQEQPLQLGLFDTILNSSHFWILYNFSRLD